MNDRISLVEAAKQAAVSRDKAKYWLELLGCCLIKEKQKSFVPLGAVVLLEAMRLAIESGLTPSAAAEHVKLTYSEKQAPKEPTKALEVPNDAVNKMAARIESLEKAVLMLVEENRTLNQRVGGIQAFLMPPEKVAAPLIPWQPEKPKDPLEGLAWYQRVWVEYFEPWRMRRYAS
jgi:hypothetical protein